MSFSQIQVLGNVGRDPEMNYTPDGTAVTKFSVAVSKKVREQEVTTWYNCTAWRNLAEMLSKHLGKGQMVFVQGDLNVRQYTTKDGRSGTALEITVDKFQFAGGAKKEAASGEFDHQPLGELEDHPF